MSVPSEARNTEVSPDLVKKKRKQSRCQNLGYVCENEWKERYRKTMQMDANAVERKQKQENRREKVASAAAKYP